MTINKEIFITGLARDCAHSLPSLLTQLETLSTLFARYHFIILENDSLDDTKTVLNAFKAKHTEAIIEYHDKIAKRHPKRTDRLAFLRNRILDIATERCNDPDNAYFLMLDLDGANNLIDAERIAHHVRQDDGSWSALFANQSEDYYDLWALRHPELCPYDIWEMVRERPKGMEKAEAIETFITSIRFNLPKDRGLIEVESAFGGLGLYLMSAIKGCRYLGLDDAGNEVCDHVALNREIIAKGGKLYIDCALINAQGTQDHAPPKSRLQKRISAVRSFFQQI